MGIRLACQVLLVGALVGCSGTDERPPIAPPAGATTGGIDPPPGGGGDPACQVPGDSGGAATDTEGATSGFKFDVGGGEGGDVELPLTCADAMARRTNVGCEFWAVDLPNDSRGTPMSPPAADQQFAIVVANSSAVEPANVIVYVGDLDTPVDAAVISVDAAHTFTLPPLNIDPLANSNDGLAYRVESDLPVTAYQFNPLDNTVPVYSNDASVLLPGHVMGRDYVAVTGDAVLLAMSEGDPDPVPAGAFISVVGLADGTLVEVRPAAPVYPGPLQDVVVDRGQVFTILSDLDQGSGNLTGSRVTASDPVAVFSGNVATVESVSAQKCCADHVEHQLLPIEAWGTAYLLAPPPSVSGSGDDSAVYRITGAFDGTSLGYCPFRPAGAPVTVGAFESHTFDTNLPFTVRSLDPDKPVSVVTFLKSAHALGSQANGNGDPAMIVVPPVDQFQSRYVFAVPEGYAGGSHVTVVTRSTEFVTLDGVTVDAEAFSTLGVHDGARYGYAHVPVAAGAHVLESFAPAGITVVGYDEAVSYGYPGGAGLKILATPPAG